MTVIEPEALAVAAARVCDDKGGTDVLVIDVGEVLGICSHFVIASASNPILVKAMSEAVEERLRDEFGQKPRSVEGAEGRRWVLIDFADIVVHVFHQEERAYYRIERLYADAPKVEWRADGHPERSEP
jgi:ribosome-associated protein